MSTIIHGVVKNGLVVPDTPLPESAHVEIHFPGGESAAAARPTPSELRKMPREKRHAILAEAAKLAEQDYRSDNDLTGFAAFSEEERNDDESDSH
jgi:hypothetical protein